MMLRSPRSLALLVLAMVFALSSTVLADDSVQTWKVDDSRSSITFTSDAPAERIVGTSEEITGEIRWDPLRPSQARGEISFPVTSMRTGNSLRDRHLAGDDWLNADENPNVTFRLESMKDVRVARSENRIDYRATAVGTITLNGVEQPSEASVEIAVLPERKLARIQPTITFALADHEITGTQGTVGAEVGRTIDVKGLVYATWE